jgi:curved DNA-binding protein CbpA
MSGKKSKAHYDVLGVPSDADEATIRKAYRRVAKKAHPDAGGTSEDFEKVSRALRVLTDQRSRDQYDRTGDDTDREPDNDFAQALSVVRQSLDAVLMKVPDPTRIDLVAEMKKVLTGKRAQIQHDIAGGMTDIKRIRKIAAKFKAKKKAPNYIGPMLASDAERIEGGVKNAEEALALVGRAILIIDDHEFDFEKWQPPAHAFSFSNAQVSWEPPPGFLGKAE